MDYQVVAVTLRDGRVIQDVAIVHHSIVTKVRGHSEIHLIQLTSRESKSLTENGIFSASVREEIKSTSNQSMKPTAPFRYESRVHHRGYRSSLYPGTPLNPTI